MNALTLAYALQKQWLGIKRATPQMDRNKPRAIKSPARVFITEPAQDACRRNETVTLGTQPTPIALADCQNTPPRIERSSERVPIHPIRLRAHG
jgi:hypothetical protein